MKKLLALVLAAVMTLSVVACGSTENNNSGNNGNVAITDALEVLTTVWGTYGEADLFPVAGGDAEHANWEGPAKFDLAATEELEATYCVTADIAANVDDAATMMHAMMINNFALGVYHLTDSAKMDEFTSTLKTNLLEKQWMCGQPEKFIVITVGEYVVAGYGLAQLIDTFEAKLTESYSSATVVCEENIA
jgi:hypothetical protein